MRYLPVNPKLIEALKTQLQLKGWLLKGQDAGQAHLVGWGYVLKWQKAIDNESTSSLWLHYKEVQGKAEAQLEMTPEAYTEISEMVNRLEEQ
ncbi:hypothetical protein QCB44_08300 [Thiomicrorhabdus sp. zzn3]|uniref:hypothetical protein n=1 Tax=Thiomicrorhabdus sp. zzn3 TaxID=3039775 RepID=UPI002436CB7A|nr:hypothetical protein [Thiomicrorhabdus sp. zzn3]MDG6778702.1 hypothetical protein [Thiomicrorhabdus sp. zzn3]